ncbi:MAG: DUF5711 family protein [Oscillospiraceae bacterium]|nr:DUF5711 family protein [Oscillospiraceae bacterium]
MNRTKTPAENPYYLNISKRLKFIKRILTFVFVVYLLSIIVIYRDEITPENFRYLIKYLDTNSPEYTGQTRTITYDSAAEFQGGVFKGDLAIVRSRYVDLYNMLGNKILSYNISYSKPVLLTSKKYMLVYAQGEYSYTINNAFTQLHTETFQFPIYLAALSDEGLYALVSKSIDYSAVIYVYDKNFNNRSKIYKDNKNVYCIKINSAGTEMLIISNYNDNGDWKTEIVTISPFSEKEKSIKILNSTFVAVADYNSEGGYTVISDKQMLFFSKDSELIKTFEFKNRGIPLKFYLGAEYSAVAINEQLLGNNNTIYIFDKYGELVYNAVHVGSLKDILINDTDAFLLFNDSIIQINIQQKTDIRIDLPASGALKVFQKDTERIIICYPQYAVTYITNELFLVYIEEDNNR